MPLWEYTGDKPVRVGGQKVSKGDKVLFSGQPGARFVEVKAPKKTEEVPSSKPKASQRNANAERNE